MAKLTFKKSYTFRERYSQIVGFDQTIAVFETGIGGKKRLVKHLDGRWPDEEYKINDYTYGADDDKYAFHYICMNHTKQVAGKDITINYNTITSFSRWTPLGTDKKAKSELLSDIKYLTPRLETDKKFAQFVQGYFPPYYEILKTGGPSSVQLIDEKNDTYQAVRENINPRRRFSTDKYFFNNGAEIDIQWVEYNATLVYAGDRYSNNWGDEMDPRDLGLKDVVAPTNYKKSVRIGLPDKERKEGEPYWFTLADKLTISTYSLVVAGETFIDIERKKEELGFSFLKSDDFSSYEFKEEKGKIVEVAPPRKVQKEWEGIKTDDEILKEILRKWQQKYKNSRLQIATNSWGYYALEPSTPTVEWLLPTDEFNLGTGSSGPNGPSGASGSSASTTEPITGSVSELKKGTYIFDVTRKDIMFNAEFGDLTILEKEDVDPFIFEENETELLDEEYTEVEFAGEEESSEVNSWTPERAQQAAAVINQLESKSIDTSNASSVIPPADPNVVPGKYDLDIIPGSYKNNDKVPITLCAIDGALVNVKIAPAYLDMRAAAKKDGISLSINSAFRSPYDSINATSKSGQKVRASSQQYLYDGYKAGKPGFNLAAKPGNSNHGDGIGLDLNAGGKSSGRYINVNEKVYEWLVKNSWRFGFVRAVKTEEWHYDYRPDVAAKGPYALLPAKDKGSVETKFYNKKKDGSYWGLDEIKIG